MLFCLLQTSFLQAILGELPFKEGSMKVNGKIAYAAQQAWVYNGSVQENILFGQDYDQTRYKEVIKVCALERVSHFQKIIRILTSKLRALDFYKPF